MQEKRKENPKTLATSGRNFSSLKGHWSILNIYWSPIWFLNVSYLSATAWKAAPANLQPSSHRAVSFAASSARVLRTKRAWGSTSMAFLDFLVVCWIRNHGNSVFDAPPALLKKRFKGFKGLTRNGKRESIRSLVVSLKAGSVPDGCSKIHIVTPKVLQVSSPLAILRAFEKKTRCSVPGFLDETDCGKVIWAYLWGLCHQKNEDYPENVGYMIYWERKDS